MNEDRASGLRIEPGSLQDGDADPGKVFPPISEASKTIDKGKKNLKKKKTKKDKKRKANRKFAKKNADQDSSSE